MTAFQLEMRDDGLGVLTFDLAGEKVNKFTREVFAELSEISPWGIAVRSSHGTPRSRA